jgi:DMSO/TMAO reductase YedYZ molybdopterin-dependent catalytic subunit
MSHEAPSLIVDGLVDRPLKLGHADLAALPEVDQVRDVSRFHPSRRGDAVTLEALLRLAGPLPRANYVTLHAGRDDFHVSVPLDAVRAEGLIVYRVGDVPLDVAQGGPVRFLIKDPTACHTTELDDCANVKYLDRIELTERKGRDTRPQDEAAHQALHAKEAGPH